MTYKIDWDCIVLIDSYHGYVYVGLHCIGFPEPYDISLSLIIFCHSLVISDLTDYLVNPEWHVLLHCRILDLVRSQYPELDCSGTLQHLQAQSTSSRLVNYLLEVFHLVH